MTRFTTRRPLRGLEPLESRDVPALFGQPWAEPSLTVSFVPDGTDIAGSPSRLFSSLNQSMPQAAWQRVTMEALQAWAAAAPLNFSVVADGGQRLGAAGAAQGDERFGDIRIAGADLGPEVLAITAPHDDFLSSTLSGDIIVNTAVAFDRDRLFRALVHEAGHALGVGPSDDPASVMYQEANGTVRLSAGDVASIQGLYGSRAADAAVVTRLERRDGAAMLAEGDLGRRSDADLFSFKGAAGTTAVRLQASGLSLLRGRVTALDADGDVVATAAAARPGEDATLTLSGLTPGRRYYLRVEGARRDAFAVGRFALVVTGAGDAPLDDDDVLTRLDEAGTVVRVRDGEHGQVVTVIAAPSGLAQVRGTLAAAETDAIRLTAPDGLAGGALTLSVAMPDGGTLPAVKVLDASGHEVSAATLVRTADGLALRVSGVAAGARYTVQLAGAGAAGYVFASQFSAEPAAPTEFLSGSLNPATGGRGTLLAVRDTALFQFTLAAEGGAVRLIVRDSTGRAVATIDAAAGQARSAAAVLLRPGVYTVEAASAGGAQGRSFRLSGVSFTDPIGPGLTDPSGRPVVDPVSDPFAFLLPIGVVILDPSVWYIPVHGGPPIFLDPKTGMPLDWGVVPQGFFAPWIHSPV